MKELTKCYCGHTTTCDCGPETGMTPKDKAEELYFKYHNLLINGNSIIAKQCALIAVDELIKETGSKFWYDVKQEINKL